jgi:hypothetical protein
MMLIRAFRLHRWVRAVKTEAASTGILAWISALIDPLMALKASTVIATGGAVFSTRERNASEAGLLLEAFSRKKKKGNTRQKKITAPITKVISSA